MRRCCCGDGGGGGTVESLCGASGTFADCVFNDEYLGLEITSASYTGSQFSIFPGQTQRYNNDYTLALSSVTAGTPSVVKCPATYVLARVSFDVEIELTLASSSCSLCSGVFPSVTTQIFQLSVVIGCQCGSPFSSYFPATTPALNGWESHRCVTTPKTFGILGQSSSSYTGNFVTPCGLLDGTNYKRFKMYADVSVPSAVCAADLTTTPPSDPFEVQFDFQLKK
jgi:hypothetical protein